MAILNVNNQHSNSSAENVYSTEETIIGTWIDGRPVYRKVIDGLTSPVDSKSITYQTGIENFDFGLICYSVIQSPVYTYHSNYISSGGHINCGFDADANVIVLTTVVGAQNKPMTLILEYVKQS